MKKKITAIAIIAVMLAIAIVGGTLAFFTDEEEVYNTLSIGKVDLTLTETSTADDGIVGTAKTDGKTGYDYTNVVPGSTYAKNVTLELSADDDEVDAYVFAEIVLTNYKELDAVIDSANDADKGGEYASSPLDGQDHAKTWLADCTLLKEHIVGAWIDGDDLHIVYDLGVWEAGDDQTLFTGVAIPEKLDASLSLITKPFDLNVKGYAIQKDNVADIETAYGQFFSQGWLG